MTGLAPDRFTWPRWGCARRGRTISQIPAVPNLAAADPQPDLAILRTKESYFTCGEHRSSGRCDCTVIRSPRLQSIRQLPLLPLLLFRRLGLARQPQSLGYHGVGPNARPATRSTARSGRPVCHIVLHQTLLLLTGRFVGHLLPWPPSAL